MTLDRDMAVLLRRMEFLAFGSVQAWNASGGGSGEPDDKVVIQVLRRDDPPHIAYLRRWERAFSESARKAVYAEAQQELALWIRRDPEANAEPQGTLEDWIIEDGTGKPAEVVAVRHNVDPAFVRRTRQKRGLSAEDGRAIGLLPEAVNREERARHLRSQGMSTREIARVLGSHQTQVMRWIRSAA